MGHVDYPHMVIHSIAILVFCGIGLFSLGPEILIALLATTTINVLGLANIVLKGIFPNRKK